MRSRQSDYIFLYLLLDVKHNLKCTLEEFYNGKTVKLKIARQTTCPTCKGIGWVTKQNPISIPGGGMQSSVQSHEMCPTCQGRKWTRTPNELEFHLRPGIRNGFRKRLKGQGDSPIPIMQAADIYLIVEQKPHDMYIRSGPVSGGMSVCMFNAASFRIC